jgi:hypothetical protein
MRLRSSINDKLAPSIKTPNVPPQNCYTAADERSINGKRQVEFNQKLGQINLM